MCNEDFSSVFVDMTEFFERFFYSKIKKAGLIHQANYLIKELIQKTGEAVLNKLKNDTSKDFSLRTLFKIKASDMWVEFVRQNKDKQVKEILEDDLIVDSPVNAIESKSRYEQLNKLFQDGENREAWEMLKLSVQKIPIEEIAERYHTTVAAVKMKIYRLRKDIQP